jgi:hypothetical protein
VKLTNCIVPLTSVNVFFTSRGSIVAVAIESLP